MYQQGTLPRRAHLGLRLGPFVRGSVGALVAHVGEGGPAARAGLRIGDVIVAADGKLLTESSSLGLAVRECGCGRPLSLSVRRDDAHLSLDVTLDPLPPEPPTDAGVDVEYGDVSWHSDAHGAHRLRSLVTKPMGALSGRAPGILHLQGLGLESCESPLADEYAPRRLCAGLSAQGSVVLRYDRSGVGDSEGPPAASLDFFAEVSQARAALAALRARPDVDPTRVFLYGHSLGGMVAPFLCGEGDPVAGVVAFGTSALRWHDCVLATTRRQRQLGGLEGEALEEQLRAWAELHELVCRAGATPAEVFARAPHLRRLESAQNRGDSMFGRHVSFFQQLDRVDLFGLWRSVRAPVLVLHGEHDWICSSEEAHAIAAAVEDGGGRASHRELPRVGHDLRTHESLLASFQSPQAGVLDDAVARAVGEWIAQVPSLQTAAPSHDGSGNTHP